MTFSTQFIHYPKLCAFLHIYNSQTAFASSAFGHRDRRRDSHGFCGRRRYTLGMTAATSGIAESKPCHIVVLGGTGRVGGETVRALLRQTPHALKITLCGRNLKRGEAIVSTLRERYNPSRDKPMIAASATFHFRTVDLLDESSIIAAVSDADVVVHTAGPFQKRQGRHATGVLRAAVNAGAAYADVCDDVSHAAICRTETDFVRQRGQVALISTGVYPGVSNILAANVAAMLRNANKYELASDQEDPLTSLRLYYHTTGSGGIGPTVLASTFLLLSEITATFSAGGVRQSHPAASLLQEIDFGGKVGRRTAYVLNLPEVESLHEIVAPKSELYAKFCTGPPIWNWLLIAMARLVRRDWLQNTEAMLKFARFSMPVVRAVDALSGGRTAIIAEASAKDGSCARISFEHESLAACVGEGTAAFVAQLVNIKTQPHEALQIPPGVWYPEELGREVRDGIVHLATSRSDRFHSSTTSGNL